MTLRVYFECVCVHLSVWGEMSSTANVYMFVLLKASLNGSLVFQCTLLSPWYFVLVIYLSVLFLTSLSLYLSQNTLSFLYWFYSIKNVEKKFNLNLEMNLRHCWWNISDFFKFLQFLKYLQCLQFLTKLLYLLNNFLPILYKIAWNFLIEKSLKEFEWPINNPSVYRVQNVRQKRFAWRCSVKAIKNSRS